MDFPRHHHHPKVERGIDDLERKRGFPAIALVERLAQFDPHGDSKEEREKERNAQILFCVSHANASIVFPENGVFVTKF